MESFNENTLLSDQDDFILVSPRVSEARRDVDVYRSDGKAYSGMRGGSQNLGPVGCEQMEMGGRLAPVVGGMEGMGTVRGRTYIYDGYRSKLEEQTEPRDHLMLLANQSLLTMRELVIARHCTGKSLHDIYQHFDRKGKLYIDAKDLMQGLSDLRIETSEKVADLMISILAIDGHDKVSYGEFAVFVTDPEHQELEYNVREQLAEQLERQGRDFQVHIFHIK